MNNQSVFSISGKVILSAFLGLLSLFLSPFGISALLGEIQINIPWSLFLPILVSMSFGWRFGILSGLSGGALFPFLLWANNGWANLLTSITFLCIYGINGLVFDSRFFKKLPEISYRLFIAISASVLLIFISFIIFFNPVLSFNPSIWGQDTIRSLPQSILYTFAFKDSINVAFLMLFSEVLLKTPMICRLFGIPTAKAAQSNNEIFLATIFVSLFVWSVFIGLSFALFSETHTLKDEHISLAFLVIISSGFFVSRMLIYYNEKQQDTQSKLIESEKKYRHLFENAQEGIFQTSIDGSYISVNPALAKMYGYEYPEDLVISRSDISHDSYFDPKERERFIHVIKEQGFVKGFEYEVKHKSGYKIWLYEDARAIKDENGTIMSFEGFVVDITKRKLAEEALEKRIIALTQPLDTPHNIDIHDLFRIDDLQVLQDALSNAFGIASIITSPDGTPITAPSNFTDLCRNIIRKTPKGCENCYLSDATIGKLCLDGPTIQTCLSGGLLDAGAGLSVGGNHIANWLIGQIRDESQTKESIRAYAMEIGADPDSAESAFLKIPSMSKEKFELVAQLLFKIADQLSSLAYQNVQQARFISERNHAENELIKAKEHAQESDRLKSAFLANMSHEIRTPMNGILGFSELLKEESLSAAEQQEFIRIIQKSGNRMLNIINDIVDISKIEAGLMTLDIKESNINEQLEYIYSFFKPEVAAKGMTLIFKTTLSAEEATIKTDREKLYAILTNLVKNAVKYSLKGEISFGYNLTTEDNKGKGKSILFYIKDTGIGIPAERQEVIFERFIQADIQDKMAHQGAGLGLAISRAYVEMLGGKIWVESEQGAGSTFYFTLPYNKFSSESSKEKITVSDTKTENLNQTVDSKLKILIVEDDQVSMNFLKLLIKPLTDNILLAYNGLEAIELCHQNPDIDLILMDIRMPKMSGLEAARKIREFNKDVVIIAQTAFVLTGDREKCIEAGCNDYVSKPVNKKVLYEMINLHCKNSLNSKKRSII